MSEKDERLAAFCKTHGHDGVWLRRRSNIAWATDGADTHCDASTSLGVASLVWTPARKTVLTDVIEAPRLAAEEPLNGWEIQACPWWEAPCPPAGRFATDFPEDDIAPLRYSLTELEIGRIRGLGAECAATMSRVMHHVKRGRTENDLAGVLSGELRRAGIFCPVLLVAADERIARFRHPIPTRNAIEKTVMAAICAQRHGLIVSITRLVHFGALPAELRRKHEAVCVVDSALHEATRPGVKWCDVLKEGIRVYRDTGFADEWTKHHQGGPMGYEPRDFKATLSESREVQPNQAVGWNPSITGTKSEDTILSTGEVVTTMSDWPMRGTRPDILERRP